MLISLASGLLLCSLVNRFLIYPILTPTSSDNSVNVPICCSVFSIHATVSISSNLQCNYYLVKLFHVLVEMPRMVSVWLGDAMDDLSLIPFRHLGIIEVQYVSIRISDNGTTYRIPEAQSQAGIIIFQFNPYSHLVSMQ